jgi:hypothetical protein
MFMKIIPYNAAKRNAIIGVASDDIARETLQSLAVLGSLRVAGYVPPKIARIEVFEVPMPAPVFHGYRRSGIEMWPQLFDEKYETGITNAKMVIADLRAYDKTLRFYRDKRIRHLRFDAERFTATLHMMMNSGEIFSEASWGRGISIAYAFSKYVVISDDPSHRLEFEMHEYLSKYCDTEAKDADIHFWLQKHAKCLKGLGCR